MLRIAVVFAFGSACLYGADCQSPPSILAMTSDPLIEKAIHARVNAGRTGIAADGASTLSREWVEGQRKEWFIENQRGGGDLVEAGVVRGDRKLVDLGLRELEWGYARQAPDGGFPKSGDAFHSISIFIVDSARALLVLREKRDQFAEFMPRVEKMIPHVEAAAEWLLRPGVLELGKQHDKPYTHRKWILAAALGEAYALTGNERLAKAAADFAAEGIALQHEDGENPEKGGFDVSYQMVDAMNGARYYSTLKCPEQAELMARVRRMLEKTCRWEMARILPSGEIEVAGSTRMLKETGRGGAIKHTNYKEIIEAFAWTSLITGDPVYKNTAERLAQSQGWISK